MIKKLYGKIFNVDPDEEIEIWASPQDPYNLNTETVTKWQFFRNKCLGCLMALVILVLVIIFF